MYKKIIFLFLISFIGFPVLSQVLEKTYEKFDFIQGNKVLFEDNFVQEMTNEIPRYWIVSSGRVETSKIGNDLCLGLLNEGRATPRKKGTYSIEDKLTFEFDYLFRSNSKTWKETVLYGTSADLNIQFHSDDEWQEINGIDEDLGSFRYPLRIQYTGVATFDDFSGNYKAGKIDEESEISEDLIDKWVHVSISINNNSLKLYLNSQRVLNAQIKSGKIFSFQFNSDYTSEEEDGFQTFIKNVRIAEGGADPYAALTTSGKFVAKGINFEVAKSSLKPESLGSINSIVQMMKSDLSLKFEIGGHTDSDGDESSNLKLSKERAETVKNKLIELGIDGSRLVAVGYGETQPLFENTTPENKANNRRVEFKKL